MTAKAMMFQGTGSDVGKSVLTAAFCRLARRRGLSVAPFKPQNMSNNAAACLSGGEIGRAQALQAKACGLEPHTDMNPVLLKPQTDKTAQLVVQGKAVKAVEAADYMGNRDTLLGVVEESFRRLSAQHDLILVEGAGSPAEINLRARDIANMGFARQLDVPVCLIGDIEKGGVIASIVGTKTVLVPDDAEMIIGCLVNKFRGDISLFDEGVREIENRTGWPCFGVIPWLPATAKLPAEDAVVRQLGPEKRQQGKLRITAPMLSRMANFDDADPLRLEPGIEFEWVAPGQSIPRDSDVVILFGTKSTLGDLRFIREQGWDHDIIAHARAGGRVLGICGGYQILGDAIHDPQGLEGEPGSLAGLGLLQVETTMQPEKRVASISGHCGRTGLALCGYEIHIGHTSGTDTQRPFAVLDGHPDGAVSASGQIEGTYLHGAFSNDEFRGSWAQGVGEGPKTAINYNQLVESALEELADHVQASGDIDRIFSCAR
jgi:adenosylcobyric acid synthase